MAEMETAARYGLNAVMVVNNNYSGGVAESVAFEGGVNFAKIADSMGCVGFRVEKAVDIRSALDKALAYGKHAIVEVLGDAAFHASAVGRLLGLLVSNSWSRRFVFEVTIPTTGDSRSR